MPQIEASMVPLKKLLYVVIDEESTGTTLKQIARPRYSRSSLTATLQLMGCKSRHSHKISERAFDLFSAEQGNEIQSSKNYSSTEMVTGFQNVHSYTNHNGKLAGPGSEAYSNIGEAIHIAEPSTSEGDSDSRKSSSQNLMQGSTITVARMKFMGTVCRALTEYQYVGPNQWSDLSIACRMRERKTSVTVLLCGTSGCGKSTLSSLLASRLGITTVVSTDSIRHMMRSFVAEKDNPLLWASTYHAGEFLDPVALAQAKAKKLAQKQHGKLSRDLFISGEIDGQGFEYEKQESGVQDKAAKAGGHKGKLTASGDGAVSVENRPQGSGEGTGGGTLVTAKELVVQGFKAQSEMVIDSLDRLISGWEKRHESVIVEGVHLSLNFVMNLMRTHPTIVPFMICIANEQKHLERFAVRARYMTLDPAGNKYVKYIRNIRTIQDYLCKRADKHLVPKVNNTNVDKSVAAIHATVFACLRRQAAGLTLFDATTCTACVVGEEYRSQYAASGLSSKGMFTLIQRRTSSPYLFSLVHDDKEWPIAARNTGGLHLRDNVDSGGPHIKVGALFDLHNEEGEASVDFRSESITFKDGHGPDGRNFGKCGPSNQGMERVHRRSGPSQPVAVTAGMEDTILGFSGLESPVYIRFGGHGLSSWASDVGSSEGEGSSGGRASVTSRYDKDAELMYSAEGVEQAKTTGSPARVDLLFTSNKETTLEAEAVMPSETEEEEAGSHTSSSDDEGGEKESPFMQDEEGSVDEEGSIEEDMEDDTPALHSNTGRQEALAQFIHANVNEDGSLENNDHARQNGYQGLEYPQAAPSASSACAGAIESRAILCPSILPHANCRSEFIRDAPGRCGKGSVERHYRPAATSGPSHPQGLDWERCR